MVVIPAYNEYENLQEILPRIPDQLNGIEVGVLVVDDGSDDDTHKILAQKDVLYIRNHINRGGGAALRAGFDILKKKGVNICVTMDADCQHQPEEIHKLIEPIFNDDWDFVIGSRILGDTERYSHLRLMGVRIFGLLVSFLLGKRITDPASGFRAFRVECLEGISLYEDQYHTGELVVDAVRKGKRIGEAAVSMCGRKHGKSKKGKEWTYAINFTKTIINTWWRK